MIVAIDFDGTIFKKVKYPEVGDPVPLAIETIKELKKAGHVLILWTCRTGVGLDKAKEKLGEYGLVFDHFNWYYQDNLSVKVNADLFIDDKAAGCPLVTMYQVDKKPETYVSWVGVREILKDKEFL